MIKKLLSLAKEPKELNYQLEKLPPEELKLIRDDLEQRRNTGKLLDEDELVLYILVAQMIKEKENISQKGAVVKGEQDYTEINLLSAITYRVPRTNIRVRLKSGEIIDSSVISSINVTTQQVTDVLRPVEQIKVIAEEKKPAPQEEKKSETGLLDNILDDEKEIEEAPTDIEYDTSQELDMDSTSVEEEKIVPEEEPNIPQDELDITDDDLPDIDIEEPVLEEEEKIETSQSEQPTDPSGSKTDIPEGSHFKFLDKYFRQEGVWGDIMSAIRDVPKKWDVFYEELNQLIQEKTDDEILRIYPSLTKQLLHSRRKRAKEGRK